MHADSSHAAIKNIVVEHSNAEKKKYLREHLHPSTAAYLESNGWMEDRPFPTFYDTDEDSWIDEAEVNGANDIVNEDVITKDRTAWCSVQ